MEIIDADCKEELEKLRSEKKEDNTEEAFLNVSVYRLRA